MTYSESAKGITISKRRALQELAAHGLADQRDIDIFFADMGDRETYKASEVLDWLGY